MMTEEEHGQLKAEAWRTLKAVDHVDAKASDEGLVISYDWRAWRSQVREVIRGDRLEIPQEPARYISADPVLFDEPSKKTPLTSEADELRARIAELEAQVVELTPPPATDITEPPPEVMAEAQPDETLIELKVRLLAEFASLRNMLVGHIPMNEAQLLRLQALENYKFQTWLQG